MSGDIDGSDSCDDEDSNQSDSDGPQGRPSGIDESTNINEISEFGLDLQQYKIAGSEARYRDQMLFTTFYLSLVALAVLLQIVIGLQDSGQLVAVMIVSAVATIGFGNLLWWSYSTKQARNRAWGFRKKIEEKFWDQDDEGLRLNYRIGSNDKFNFTNSEYVDSNNILGNSSSDLVIGFAAVTTVGWIVTTGGSVALLLSDNPSENTPGLLIAGGSVVLFIVFVIYIILNSTLNQNGDDSESDDESE